MTQNKTGHQLLKEQEEKAIGDLTEVIIAVVLQAHPEQVRWALTLLPEEMREKVRFAIFDTIHETFSKRGIHTIENINQYLRKFRYG